MRCQQEWGGCYSPTACRDWGYCRERNISAGGMQNVTPEMQAEWRKVDCMTPPTRETRPTKGQDG